MKQTSWSSLLWFTAAMALSLVNLFNTGCAPKQIHSHWADAQITADGSESDWLHPPQHYDSETSERVRVTNDRETLNICFSVKSDKLERQLRMRGLTLWIDPLGGQSETFGIHLPGAKPDFRRRAAPATAGVQNGSPDSKGRIGSNRIENPKTLHITYSDATGPLKMHSSEIQASGIDIDVTGSQETGIVYEFSIRFRAAPSLESLVLPARVGIGFQSGTGNKNDQKESAPLHAAFRPGGRGMGGKTMGDGRGRKMGKPYEKWFVIQLVQSP